MNILISTNMKYTKKLLFTAAGLALAAHTAYAGNLTGRVVDALTKAPIADASVSRNGTVVRTGADGRFELPDAGGKVGVKAPGYRLQEVDESSSSGPADIQLVPFTPKALYLSFYGIGDRKMRNKALDLISTTEINSLVIDVKGDKGFVPYHSSVPLVSEVGGQKIITVRDVKGLLALLHSRGIYTIGRIVVFKDTPLATKRPDLMVKTRTGDVWRDREGLAWTDPFKKEVWDYNVDIAVEAAQLGFDEIQFDYVRFPDSHQPQFSQPSTEEGRVAAISGFLAEAQKRLAPYNVFLSANIFGYVCWNRNDTYIGQKLDQIAQHVDYIAPMLYPSGFQYGIPGYRKPVEHPNEIVYLTLKRARERLGLPATRFRPWLQAFRDYAFDRRYFTGELIKQQVEAAETFGSNGWMLWNPRNSYSPDGLSKRVAVAENH